MKKSLIIGILITLSSVFYLKAQCDFNYTVSGSTVTFLYSHSLSPFFNIDSVAIDFGDGSHHTMINNPPSSSFAFNYMHAYTTSGNYTVCLNEYTSWGGSPQNPCLHCETIVVGPSSSCFAAAEYTSASTNLTATFTNTTSCPTCTSLTYAWNFGDASPVSTVISPTHTYAVAGTYDVCLIATGVNASMATCIDTFCNSVSVQQTSIYCTTLAEFAYSNASYTFTFIDQTSCTPCATINYFWSFGDGTIAYIQNPSHTYTGNGTYNVCLYVSGVSPTGDICLDTVCKTLVLSDVGICNAEQAGFIVYPNPANNEVSIHMPDKNNIKEIILLDIIGRKLSAYTNLPMNNEVFQIDLSLYPSGTYFLQFVSPEDIYQSIVIKE